MLLPYPNITVFIEILDATYLKPLFWPLPEYRPVVRHGAGTTSPPVSLLREVFHRLMHLAGKIKPFREGLYFTMHDKIDQSKIRG
jgi:hypothetical protein